MQSIMNLLSRNRAMSSHETSRGAKTKVHHGEVMVDADFRSVQSKQTDRIRSRGSDISQKSSPKVRFTRPLSSDADSREEPKGGLDKLKFVPKRAVTPRCLQFNNP